MTSPVFSAAGPLANYQSTNSVVTRPSVSVGDLMLMFIVRDGGHAAPSFSGWTHLYTNNTSDVFSFSQSVLYKIAGGSEPTTYALDMSTSGGGAIILSYTADDATTPIQAYTTQSNAASSTSVAVPSVTATTTDTTLIAFQSAFNSAMGPYTPDAAMTERADCAPAGFNSNFSVADQTISASGATGTRTATANAAGSSYSFAILLAPVSGDTTAPTLSSPTGTKTGSTTATGTVSTDTAEGTMYTVVSTSATPPSVAQIQAAHDQSGGAGAYAANATISATGVHSFFATGLTASTTYYFYFQHKDVAGNDSTVSSSSSFTTDATPTSTLPIVMRIF